MEQRWQRKDCVVCSDRSKNGMRHLTLILVQPVPTIHHFVLGNASSCITLKGYIRENELLYIAIAI